MRLVTRADFDGLMCAVLLKQVENVEEIVFVHPKDIQDGMFHITSDDIIANLPYDPNCGMWFDHHSSEEERVDIDADFKGEFRIAPSAARVIHDYYGSNNFTRLGGTPHEKVLEAVDKVDSAQLSIKDITHPEDWILLSYIMDPRTGLGKFHHFEIGNYQLMLKLVEWIPQTPIEEILEYSHIQERVKFYFEQNEKFQEELKKNSTIDKNVVITDFRDFDQISAGNRFLIYTLFPQSNVSVRVSKGYKGQGIVIAVGHNILNRSCKTNIGDLMSNYGGGGHRGAGTCQWQDDFDESYLGDIIRTLKTNG